MLGQPLQRKIRSREKREERERSTEIETRKEEGNKIDEERDRRSQEEMKLRGFLERISVAFQVLSTKELSYSDRGRWWAK